MDDTVNNPPEADGWVKENGGWVKLNPEDNDEEEAGKTVG